MTDYKGLVDIAIEAAKAAGREVMVIYNSGDYASYEKKDDSPVTSADYAANDIICDWLELETPDIPILSEEKADISFEERKNWKRYWLIDPIDGTQEFIARSGDFAVNIALIEDNKPVVGVIFWPAGDTLYYAAKHMGAFKVDKLGKQSISTNRFADNQPDVLMLAISRRQPQERVLSRLTSKLSYQTLPVGSCSLKACFIAEGKADLFLRVGTTGEWDTGASQCIVEEAGGTILDSKLDPLTYNLKPSLNNPNFVVLGDPGVNWAKIVHDKN